MASWQEFEEDRVWGSSRPNHIDSRPIDFQKTAKIATIHPIMPKYKFCRLFLSLESFKRRLFIDFLELRLRKELQNHHMWPLRGSPTLGPLEVALGEGAPLPPWRKLGFTARGPRETGFSWCPSWVIGSSRSQPMTSLWAEIAWNMLWDTSTDTPGVGLHHLCRLSPGNVFFLFLFGNLDQSWLVNSNPSSTNFTRMVEKRYLKPPATQNSGASRKPSSLQTNT